MLRVTVITVIVSIKLLISFAEEKWHDVMSKIELTLGAALM